MKHAFGVRNYFATSNKQLAAILYWTLLAVKKNIVVCAVISIIVSKTTTASRSERFATISAAKPASEYRALAVKIEC